VYTIIHVYTRPKSLRSLQEIIVCVYTIWPTSKGGATNLKVGGVNALEVGWEGGVNTVKALKIQTGGGA